MDSALKAGFNGKCFNIRKSPNDRFTVDLQKLHRPAGNWKEEALNVVDQIINQSKSSGRKIVLFFSGGKDCEAVLRLFLERDQIPLIKIVRYAKDSNLKELCQGIVSLDELQVPYEIYDFDPYKFIESEYFETITNREGISFPSYIFLSQFFERHKDDFLVLGHEGFQIVKSRYYEFRENEYPSTPWNFCIPEKGQYLNAYFHRHELTGVVNFFSHTSELLYAYLNDDVIQKMISNELTGCWQSGFGGAEFFYKKWFPNMRARKKIDVIGSNCQSFDLIIRSFQKLNTQKINLTQTVTKQIPIKTVVGYLAGENVNLNELGIDVLDWRHPDPFNFDTSKWKIYQEIG